ncbi:MAG: LppX_LprAFG lipoprotein [Chloroflexota bacterium]|nr:LppX_LprAFG lipoprotein [Chloroflexota bacterium]
MFWRAVILVLASISIACSQPATLVEPSPTELLQKASANLKNAKTAHIDGTGSFAINSGLSISFDFKLNGDAEMPDKSRLTTQMSLLGQSVSVDTITIGARTFSKGLMGSDWTETAENDPQGAVLDPLGQADLSAVAGVTEVDRPEIDGRKTRHLSYTIDPNKLAEKMKGSQPGATPALNVSGATGKGEVWIRTDDNQIVRQLVKLSVDMAGDLGIPGASPASGKSAFEISFDLKFTQIGEPVSPAITAPPGY